VYNYITIQTKFFFVPWLGLAGMFFTFVFLPDTTGLDLKEQERRWRYIREDRAEEYHGVAVHPTHLSMWEIWRGVGKSYDPQLDHKAKMADLRADWEAVHTARGDKDVESDGLAGYEDADFTPEVHAYFQRSAPISVKL